MKLCDYGCGQEAKHQFKNGKWCCSKDFRSCISQRKKKSIQTKELWKDPNNKLGSILHKERQSDSIRKMWQNSILRRKKQSNIMKDIWKDPNSKLNSISCKEKQSKRLREARKDPNSKYNSISFKENHSNIMKELHKDPNSKYNLKSYKEKLSNSAKKARKTLNNKYDLVKLTIEKINEKYPFFSKIEKMRYNPDKSEEKEIQVHCKNHECKDGWFTPTYIQLYERIRQLESKEASGGCYLYCSQHCKDTCPLYYLNGDPYRYINKPYTSEELKTFNKLVLKRDNEICYYCREHHATIVHHLRPQKLEPFFALDPDYAISVCKKCHYEKGHPTGSEHSTGNLAKVVCSVESQKFLEQNHK